MTLQLSLDRPRARATPAQQERILLVFAGAFLLVNTFAWTLNGGVTGDWVHLAVWAFCTAAGHLWLNRSLPTRDPLPFAVAMFLSGWGMVLIERLAPNFADRQTVWLVVGVAALCVTASVPNLLRMLRTYRYILLLGGLVLLVATILFGVNPSGQETAPQLWLGFGAIYFQPSEVLKIILVAFLASYLAEQYPTLQTLRARDGGRLAGFSLRVVGPVLLMFAVSVIVLVWQRDLGTATLFFIVFLLMLYLATGFGWLLIGGTLLVAGVAFAAYQIIDLVQLRVDIWLNPWLEPDGRAFQIVQSLFAFAAGGIAGRGIGSGSPTFIPVVHSDFVFAALGEEWGLLGVIALLMCILMLVGRGFRIAATNNQIPFFCLLAAGLSLLVGIQSLLIMGGVLKLIPLTGVTLPFVSYGGSSLLVNFIIVGLLLRLSDEVDERGA